MSNAILHTEIDREIDSPLAPEQVQEKLQQAHPNLTFQEYNGDDIPFYYRDERMYLEGIIQRWQGTESHIEVSAKVIMPPTSRNIIQVMILAILLTLMAVTVFALPATANLSDFFAECTTIQSGDVGCGGATLSAVFPVFVLVFAWIVGVFGIVAARQYDPNSKKRWQAQQDMGAKIDKIIATIEA